MLRIHAIIGPMTNAYILVVMVAGAGVGAQIAVNAGLGAATMAHRSESGSLWMVWCDRAHPVE